MPLLDEDGVRNLSATPPKPCDCCDGMLHKNYCRQCDAFFWSGHAPSCAMLRIEEPYGDYHTGHRLTLEIAYEKRQEFDADKIVC